VKLNSATNCSGKDAQKNALPQVLALLLVPA
jgi:hypothetical protein